jgi:Cu/Ag efflux protein CusF
MRKLMIAASAAALLGLVSAASAAEVTGTVSAVDEANHTITLDSGQTFTIANASKTEQTTQADAAGSFKAGDKVKITYDETGGKLTATQITPAM